MAYNRDAVKTKARSLAKRGLSTREIAARTKTSKSTIHRWTKGVLPAAPSKVEAPTPGEGTDLTTISGLEAEQTRLYSTLDSQGFSRAVALQLSVVTKALGVLQLSGCEGHWTIEDVRRLCADLNDLWLRHLEVATRDMTQVSQTAAVRILDRAIEKVRVEAEVLQ